MTFTAKQTADIEAVMVKFQVSSGERQKTGRRKTEDQMGFTRRCETARG
jgi:hypothetical protein